MPYLADYFSGRNDRRDQEPDDPYDMPGVPPGPVAPANPAGPAAPVSPAPGAGPAPGTPPAAPGGPAGPVGVGPGTGFVPLAAYFGPNREGAQKLAQGVMDKFPENQLTPGRAVPGYFTPGGEYITDPNAAGYRVRDANSQAEASAQFDTMNPLDAFLARQAGGANLYARLADWAKPYQGPPQNLGTPAPSQPERPVGPPGGKPGNGVEPPDPFSGDEEYGPLGRRRKK